MNDRRPELTEGQSQPRSTGIGKWILSITLVVALLAGGTVVASLLSRFKEEPARRESIAVIPVVRTQTLQPENVTELYLGYGSVDPIQQAVVAAEVPGRVVELPAELREGKEIRKGDVLLKIDDREFRQAKARADAFLRADQAALDELKIEAEKLGDLMATAQHEIELTEAEWNRISALYEKNLAAKKEFDFANLAWKQATRVLQGYEMQASRIQPRSQQLLASMAAKEADAQTAELNMERCTVKAPFDGVIMQRFVDPGNRVGPGMQLFSIVNNNVVEVPAQLPGSVYGKIKVGAECVLQSESMTDVQWTGTVSRIAPTVDQQTRTFAAYIVIDNQE
ncbi:MAG: efflux RND transporter periplasmic adaptor subunit, partial [Phycisphaerae bacterium]